MSDGIDDDADREYELRSTSHRCDLKDAIHQLACRTHWINGSAMISFRLKALRTMPCVARCHNDEKERRKFTEKRNNERFVGDKLCVSWRWRRHWHNSAWNSVCMSPIEFVAYATRLILFKPIHKRKRQQKEGSESKGESAVNVVPFLPFNLSTFFRFLQVNNNNNVSVVDDCQYPI